MAGFYSAPYTCSSRRNHHGNMHFAAWTVRHHFTLGGDKQAAMHCRISSSIPQFMFSCLISRRQDRVFAWICQSSERRQSTFVAQGPAFINSRSRGAGRSHASTPPCRSSRSRGAPRPRVSVYHEHVTILIHLQSTVWRSVPPIERRRVEMIKRADVDDRFI